MSFYSGRVVSVVCLHLRQQMADSKYIDNVTQLTGRLILFEICTDLISININARKHDCYSRVNYTEITDERIQIRTLATLHRKPQISSCL